MYGFLINEDKLRTERIKSLGCSLDIFTLAELFSVVFNVTFTLTSEKWEKLLHTGLYYEAMKTTEQNAMFKRETLCCFFEESC